jgi:hypothetical protein
MQMRAMKYVIRRFKIVLESLTKSRVTDYVASLPSTEINALGLNSVLMQALDHVPALKQSSRVGGNLDARTDPSGC